MNLETDLATLRQLLLDTLRNRDFCRATFGGKVRRADPAPWVRVTVRPVELRGRTHLQFGYFDTRKNFTKNHAGADIEAPLDEILAFEFSDIHLTTRTEEIDIRTTKKGKILISRRALAVESSPVPQPHNRVKDVPLPEGQADSLLAAMGILTREGRVRPTFRAKYTQINEFLRQLARVLDEAWPQRPEGTLRILDCGCGASYLTLAAHHYLNEILRIPAHLIGVDVNEEVIRKSIERSERLGAERLEFTSGRIDALTTRPDIVLALHACDTATDDAIAGAIRAEATVVLCVPCCHHHLNDAIRPEGAAEVLRPLLRHGILHQRTADLVTDAFRALVLRILGYRTDVVEFISPEHTARNLMIRAVRIAPVGTPAFVREYQEMRRFWNVTPYLEGVLGEPFQNLVGTLAGTVS